MTIPHVIVKDKDIFSEQVKLSLDFENLLHCHQALDRAFESFRETYSEYKGTKASIYELMTKITNVGEELENYNYSYPKRLLYKAVSDKYLVELRGMAVKLNIKVEL